MDAILRRVHVQRNGAEEEIGTANQSRQIQPEDSHHAQDYGGIRTINLFLKDICQCSLSGCILDRAMKQTLLTKGDALHRPNP